MDRVIIRRILNSEAWCVFAGLLWAFAPAMGVQALIWGGVPISGEESDGGFK